VLYNPPPSDLQHDLRYRCRNPRCRCKLPEPTSISRNAFCTRGCYLGFYRTRCVVCEKVFERKNEREKTCGRRQCRLAFKRDRARFLGSRYGGGGEATGVLETARSAQSTGLQKPHNADRPWRIIAGPELNLRSLQAAALPLDLATASRVDRINRGFAAEAAGSALIRRHDPPINVLAGYRFPDAPEIKLSPSEPKPPARVRSTLTATIPANLSIPDFLKCPHRSVS
jgi:hypothetical protein